MNEGLIQAMETVAAWYDSEGASQRQDQTTSRCCRAMAECIREHQRLLMLERQAAQKGEEAQP